MKGLVSLAELFIMVCILFLIQTVLNFASSPADVETQVKSYATLNISQVPSGRHFIDHIKSIQIGQYEMKFKSGGCNTDSPHFHTASHMLEASGKCSAYESDTLTSWSIDNKEEVKLFLENQPKVTNVAVNISDSSNLGTEQSSLGELKWPKAINLFWRPDDIDEDLIVKVSYCLCQLGSTDVNRHSPENWNLGESKLLHPHPLVMRYTFIEGSVSRNIHLDYFNNKNTKRNSPIESPFNVNRYDLYKTKDCSGSRRSNRTRAVEIKLADLRG